jgi:hypothetical protein
MSDTTSTGAYHTANGQIIAPNGTAFVARGVNVMEGNNPSAAVLQQDFPGINFVRLAVYNYESPDTLLAYVNDLTSHGIVVELEDHNNQQFSFCRDGRDPRLFYATWRFPEYRVCPIESE